MSGMLLPRVLSDTTCAGLPPAPVAEHRGPAPASVQAAAAAQPNAKTQPAGSILSQPQEQTQQPKTNKRARMREQVDSPAGSGVKPNGEQAWLTS